MVPRKSPFHFWAHKSSGTHNSDYIGVVLFLFRRPDTVKQKNAFPPNFIHSLDSTHMMITSLHCYRYLCCKCVFILVLQSGLNPSSWTLLLPSFNSSFIHSAGVTFVSVHDCFWTHALTVDTMNKVSFSQFGLDWTDCTNEILSCFVWIEVTALWICEKKRFIFMHLQIAEFQLSWINGCRLCLLSSSSDSDTELNKWSKLT